MARKKQVIPAAVPMFDIHGNVTNSYDKATWRERAAHAIERVAMGDSLADLPIRASELHAAIRADDELREAYRLACEVKATLIAERAMALADESPRLYDTQYSERVDSGHVAWIRARLDMARWYVSVLDPARFGPPAARAEGDAPGAVGRPTFVIESSREAADAARTVDAEPVSTDQHAKAK